MSIKGDFSLSL